LETRIFVIIVRQKQIKIHLNEAYTLRKGSKIINAMPAMPLAKLRSTPNTSQTQTKQQWVPPREDVSLVYKMELTAETEEEQKT
jgi:hypothetical protein